MCKAGAKVAPGESPKALRAGEAAMHPLNRSAVILAAAGWNGASAPWSAVSCVSSLLRPGWPRSAIHGKGIVALNTHALAAHAHKKFLKRRGHFSRGFQR